MTRDKFLHDALDAALPVLDTHPDGIYVVVACNDATGTIFLATGGRTYTSKIAAAAQQDP